jgi:hypothetical protein
MRAVHGGGGCSVFNPECSACFHYFLFLEISGIFGNRYISFRIDRCTHHLNNLSLDPFKTGQTWEKNTVSGLVGSSVYKKICSE